MSEEKREQVEVKENEVDNKGSGNPEAEQENERKETYDTQELLVKIAKLEREKNKASSEAADWKKKFRATQSVQEIAVAETQEQKARLEEDNEQLHRQVNIMTLEKSYQGMGFTADEAGRMAVAEADNEFETKMKILAEVDARKKKDFEAEFIKSRPEINASSSKEEEDLFIKGFNSVKPNF